MSRPPADQSSPEKRGRFQGSSRDLERGVHVPFDEQVESVSVDQPPAWPDWQEQQRQSQLAGGGIA